MSMQIAAVAALQWFRKLFYPDSSPFFILLVGVMDPSVADYREELLQAARA